MKEVFQQAYQQLRRSKHILITTHRNMDGDGLSSMLALYIIMKEVYGKQVTLLCHDSSVPEVFRFLPHTDSISFEFSENREFVISVASRHAEVEQVRYVAREDGGADIIITPRGGQFDKTDFSFTQGRSSVDCIVVVDSSDLRHLGHIYEQNRELFEQTPLINIDHHESNEGFGTINLVDKSSVSTTEVIYHMLMQEDPEMINAEVATNILTGIIVDTRSFQNANTTGRSLEVASELLQKGAKQQEIIKHVYKTKKLSTLKLWGKVLSRLQFDPQYRYVWSSITRADFMDLGATEAEADGIIDELMSNAPNADVILLFKEGLDDVIAVSVRTKRPEVNAIEIVQHFGGGGHKMAAGCKIPGMTLQNAEQAVLERVRAYQLQHERIDLVRPAQGQVAMPRMEDTLRSQQLFGQETAGQQLPNAEEKSTMPEIVKEEVKETTIPLATERKDTVKKEAKESTKVTPPTGSVSNELII